MKSILILGVTAFFLFVVIGSIRHYEIKVMEEHVGEKVVIDHDTLTIVSFSTFTDEYMLSNGTSISDEYLENINQPKQ